MLWAIFQRESTVRQVTKLILPGPALHHAKGSEKAVFSILFGKTDSYGECGEVSMVSNGVKW